MCFYFFCFPLKNGSSSFEMFCDASIRDSLPAEQYSLIMLTVVPSIFSRNKTAAEIEFALNAGVGTFVVDNLYELELLNEIAGKLGKKAKISFRIKPGVDAHTHNFIRTGQIDSKFGFALETGEAFEAVKKALEYEM